MKESTLAAAVVSPPLTTAHVADAAVRLKLPIHIAPSGLRPAFPGARCFGRVLPARHRGSVDVFLEAFQQASPGDVLVADNGGNLDQACIGDLVTLEAKLHGLAGIVIWGLHRDTEEVEQIGLPLFSYGTCPLGPTEAAPREAEDLATVNFGPFRVDSSFQVMADADGALFFSSAHRLRLLAMAESIATREREQSRQMAGGLKLTEQLRFSEYLQRRDQDHSFTFRRHLRELGGAIEE